MPDDKRVIDQYLRLTLLPAESDEDVAKLYAIGDAVGDALRTDPSRAPRYAMVGMDPVIDDADPTISEIDDIIQGKWPSFNNRYRTKAVNVARGAIADALAAESKKSSSIAACVSLTARNVGPYVDLGVEEALWKTLVEAADVTAAEAVRLLWNLEPITDNNISYRSLSAASVAHAFRQALGAATAADGTALAVTNPLVVANAAAWAETAAKTIGEALADQSDGFAKTNAQHVIEYVKRQIAPQQALIYRSELLWWKESLYSTSLHDGYRALTTALGAVAMARDLSQLCPKFAPTSVEWILRESIIDAYGQKDKKQPIGAHLEALVADVRRGLLGKEWPRREPSAGRRSLAQFLGELLRGEAAAANLRDATGTDTSQSMTIGDVASIVFRGLQASKAVVD